VQGKTGAALAAGGLLALAALTASAPRASADDPPRPARAKAEPAKPKKAAAVSDADAEAAALAFVRENHPELADLLASLKPMRPDEYRKAIRDLSQVSRALAQLKDRDAKRYALGLEAWKARSQVELLTARLVSAGGTSAELEGELRKAVEAQIDVEIRQQRYEKQAAEERLKKVSENLKRLESRREATAESRFQSLLKKGRSARRQDTARAKTKPSNDPKSAVTVTPRAGAGEGERQP